MEENQLKVLGAVLTGSAIMTIAVFPLFEAGKFALGMSMILPFFIVAVIIIYFSN
jgi:hypothetical protein